MVDTTQFCCAFSRNDQFNTTGRYRYTLSHDLKSVSGSIDTHVSLIALGAQGINVPIPRGGPPTASA